jgi:restriction system protein
MRIHRGGLFAMIRDMSDVRVPPYQELLLPTLRATHGLGGSASINEIVETVIEREGFTEEQEAVLHNDGPETEIRYRLAWARTYLKGMGLLTNSARGVWTLTDKGSVLLTDPGLDEATRREHMRALRAEYINAGRKERQLRATQPGTSEVRPEPESEASDWKSQLLDALMSMEPDAFERLAKRLLREADFDSVNVTGRSGDGGIDGLGVYRLGLLSFPVFFQCKRYRGNVGAGAVRDFRGAMAGRGDKGLLITTASFTSDAKNEAKREGAPPIDLINGDRLCDLLRRYEIGVRTEMVEEVTVQRSFFLEL